MIVSVFRGKVPPAGAVPALRGETCLRCGARILPGWKTEGERRFCRECLAFGLVTEDDFLVFRERPLVWNEPVLCRKFPLSPGQKEASAFAVSCLEEGVSGFLEAVCGAGKTEILFDFLFSAFEKRFRVAWAIPRRDIVAELAPRLGEAFPTLVVKALHAEAKDDAGAHLVVSTIHQLIRYREEFDWIVLDEADAFPYRDDPLLHRLLRKALRPQGRLFLLSATTNKEMAASVRLGEFRRFGLPARFHGHAWDEPRCVRIPDLAKAILREGVLPSALLIWLSPRKKEGRRTLLFVPSVRFGEVLSELMNRSGFPSVSLSSRTEGRQDLLRRFRGGEWDFLVTTTLLERGVTFSGVDVAVLAADHPVFDSPTLVQIAGRAGRDPLRPRGDVVFFSEDLTEAMVSALRHVRKSNREGRKAGWIRDDL